MKRNINILAIIAATWLTMATVVAQDASPPPQEPVKRTAWGWNLGGIFTDIPISYAIDSGFAVLVAHAYYSWFLSDPKDFVRTSASLGVYGFQIILPVPAVSTEIYLGDPTADVQLKGSIAGFWDITVGGHAGVGLGLGALIKNRFNVSFFAMPVGIDSKRDYLGMIGTRDEEKPCTDSDPCVKMPYFGLFVGMQY